MATNLRFLNNNLIFESGVTVTAGSSAYVSLPASNILDSNRKKVWRSGGNHGTLNFDLGTAQRANAFGLISSNLGTTGTVIIYASGGLTKTTAQSGTLSQGNTWADGTAPRDWDNVVVANGHTLVIDTSLSLAASSNGIAFHVQDGGTALCPTTQVLTLNGRMQVDGYLQVDGFLDTPSGSFSGSSGSLAYSSGVLNPLHSENGVQVFFIDNKFYRYLQVIISGIEESGVVRTSAQSGTFTDLNTWTGGIIPQEWDSMVIANGHTVVLDTSSNLGNSVNGTAIHIHSGGTMKVVGTCTLTTLGLFQVDGYLDDPTGALYIQDKSLTGELDIEIGAVWFGTYTEFEKKIQYGWEYIINSLNKTAYSINGVPYTDKFDNTREILFNIENITENWAINTLAPVLDSTLGKESILVLAPDSISGLLGHNTNLYGRINSAEVFRYSEFQRCDVEIEFLESL